MNHKVNIYGLHVSSHSISEKHSSCLLIQHSKSHTTKNIIAIVHSGNYTILKLYYNMMFQTLNPMYLKVINVVFKDLTSSLKPQQRKHLSLLVQIKI